MYKEFTMMDTSELLTKDSKTMLGL